MICTCIDNRNYQQIEEILSRDDLEMAEVRLDLCLLSDDEICKVFSQSRIPLTATCRVSECGGETVALQRLSEAVTAGADFVDLEIEASENLSLSIISLCRENGVRLIRSYHNFKYTPSLSELKAVTKECFEKGADIAKVVTTALSDGDNRTVSQLYECFDKGSLVAFSMGSVGTKSRVEALSFGAPFTYAALEDGGGTAPGQICYKDYLLQLYSNIRNINNDKYKAPASKSYAQRAIIAAALASGESLISDFSICDDSAWALNVASCLGAEVTVDGDKLKIKGIGASGGSVCLSALNTGESGLLTRMMIPLISAVGCGECIVTGCGTLLGRPLKGVGEAMSKFGVSVSSIAGDEIKIPLRIKGKLHSGTFEVDGSEGSQLITGMLMSLPLLDGDSVLVVHNARSVPYLYMTLNILRSFGISINESVLSDNDLKFEINGGQRYKAANISLEGDWSGASNFLVAAAIGGKLSSDNLLLDSAQADKVIAEVIENAGAKVFSSDGKLCVSKSPLRPFEVNLKDSPDIIPIVALFASFCPGMSKISGMSRLLNKESNRVESISSSFDALGIGYELNGDELKIYGESLTSRILNDKLLRGGHFHSFNDHRIVMLLKVASMFSSSEIIIDNSACVAKSYPAFLKDFDSF